MVKKFCSICSSKNHRGGGNIKYFCLRGGRNTLGGGFAWGDLGGGGHYDYAKCDHLTSLKFSLTTMVANIQPSKKKL